MKDQNSIAVIVLTYNEEKNLPECIESLKQIPHTLYLVDSGSTDRTLAIAEKNQAKIYHHIFQNYADQRNWAIHNIPIKETWTLHLDADERLSQSLAQNIVSILSKQTTDIQGYYAARRTYFMGKWIKHGGHYPVYHLRLLKTGFGSCEERLYDQHFIVKGACKKIEGDIIDVVASDINTWIERHLRWSFAEAQEYIKNNASNQMPSRLFSKNKMFQRRWLKNNLYNHLPLFWRVLFYTLYRYFLRGGFLDGKEGAVFHLLQGAWFRWMVDVHIDNLQRPHSS
jgi:glycosyltransferase involved in cell wall biosynthesis